MLDLDSPQAPHIIAAFKQLELIGFYSNSMTLCPASERRDMFQIIQPAFAALRWLNNSQFDGSDCIDESIAQLERAIRELSELTTDDDVPSNSDRCPACNDPVTEIEEYRSMNLVFLQRQYCGRCSEIVEPAFHRIGSAELGFGTEVI